VKRIMGCSFNGRSDGGRKEGLISSIIGLLGLALAVPDRSTLSRRAPMLVVPRPQSGSGAEPEHLLVDSTGLKLCGAGEYLIEKHCTKTRRFWRKLHIGMDAETGEIVAAELTMNDVDDASLAQGWASDDRGRRCRSCPEPDAGIGTPDFRPHRMNADGVGGIATQSPIHATTPR
jgi:Transposase DDE domain